MGKSVKYSSKMDSDVLKQAKAFAKESKRPLSSIISEAVENHLRLVRVRPAVQSLLSETMQEYDDLLRRLADR